jgi:hypothetical protein
MGDGSCVQDGNLYNLGRAGELFPRAHQGFGGTRERRWPDSHIFLFAFVVFLSKLS